MEIAKPRLVEGKRYVPMEVPGPTKVPLRVGALGTALWLIVGASYCATRGQQILNLPPDQLGDFLAGIFAPLAFLWLVVGYLQQANEFRFQVHELTLQVQTSRELAAAATAEAARATASVQPKFGLEMTADVSRPAVFLSISHVGGVISDLHLAPDHEILPSEVEIVSHAMATLLPGASFTIQLCGAEPHGWLKLAYTDAFAQQQHCWLYVCSGRNIFRFRRFGEDRLDQEATQKWLATGAGRS